MNRSIINIPNIIAKDWNELTDYPNIYSKTYWGNFSNKEENHPGNRIIVNRNNFIRLQPGIKISKKNIRGIFPWPYCDHNELYQQGDVYILLTSPYEKGEEQLNYFREEGWAIIPPMYTEGAITFIKCIKVGRRGLQVQHNTKERAEHLNINL